MPEKICKCCGETKTLNMFPKASLKCKSCKALDERERRRAEDFKKTLISSEKMAWKNMKTRCGYKKHTQFNRYGGRGIIVCDRWKSSFKNFIEDVGNKPGTEYSLERIDNNGNYEPSNVRWATSSEQARNTSRNLKVDINGSEMIALDASKLLNINYTTFTDRIKSGKTGEDLIRPASKGPRNFFDYKGMSLSILDIAELTGFTYSHVYQTLVIKKLPLENLLQ